MIKYRKNDNWYILSFSTTSFDEIGKIIMEALWKVDKKDGCYIDIVDVSTNSVKEEFRTSHYVAVYYAIIKEEKEVKIEI